MKDLGLRGKGKDAPVRERRFPADDACSAAGGSRTFEFAEPYNIVVSILFSIIPIHDPNIIPLWTLNPTPPKRLGNPNSQFGRAAGGSATCPVAYDVLSKGDFQRCLLFS